jgi:UDP-N-acetylglucosamine acyltransferase
MIQIHPSAVVHRDTKLAEGVTIGPNCVIAGGVSVGSDTQLDANVVINRSVTIGKNNHFFANCVIGGLPQILGMDSDDERGGLVIGDNNIFREQVTIHPSMYEDGKTKVGSENLLMIGAHIGHDCVIEDKIVMSNYVQLSGHCKIETGVWLSGMVVLHQFVTIGKWCYAAGLAGINRDIPPFLVVSGHYPPRIRGVNKRGMQRAGLNARQQENIFEAYQKLYRQGNTLLENARALSHENGIDENVRAMIDAIAKSSEHRFGRYLETLRRH